MTKSTKGKQQEQLRAIAAGKGGRPEKAPSANRVRVGVWIDPALHKRAKIAAAERETTLSDLVALALENELRR